MSISKSWNGGTVTVPERTNKAWGDYTTDALVKVIDGAISDADVVNDLTTGGAAKVLSAEQGKTLKTQVDAKQDSATAVTEASAAAGAGNVMVSAGADRTIQDSGVAFSGVARGSSLTADNVVTGNGTNNVKNSGVAIANIPTMAAAGGAGELLYTAAADKAVAKAGVVAANVVTNATGNAAAIGNIIVAAATDKTVKDSTMPVAGIAIQQKIVSTTSYLTGTTTIPIDDTIPQITEGTEFLTTTFTPKLSTSRILVQFNGMVGHSVAGHIITALFKDGASSAVCSTDLYAATSGNPNNCTMVYSFSPSSTSPITLAIRIGSNAAGTYSINGFGGSRYLGGSTVASMTITEYGA